jgi:hypothetical protein
VSVYLQHGTNNHLVTMVQNNQLGLNYCDLINKSYSLIRKNSCCLLIFPLIKIEI